MTHLLTYLKTSGTTQAEFAAKLGVTQSCVSRLLRSNRTPSLKLAIKIERVTGGAVPASSWHEVAA